LFFISVLFFSLLSGHQAQAQQRRGWSPQVKGAAIGGAAGLLGGALINGRNRKVGGLIGGVAGVGAGYAVGKHIDNKQKKAAALAAERAAANRRLAVANAHAAASSGSVARVAGATSLASASVGTAQSLGGNLASNMVPAGYLPNPQFGVAGTAYPASEVRRKSW